MSNSIQSLELTEKEEKQEKLLSKSSSDNSIKIDIALSSEENIRKIIKRDIMHNNLHISSKKIMSDLLKKLEHFKEFILLYNIEQDLIFEILSTGILKAYKKNEIIYTKGTYPECFYLVLVGSVADHNLQKEYFEGNFFGEKFMIINKKYRANSYANKDNTILLLITKEFFMLNLKNKIIKGNEKIRLTIIKSFEIFRMVEIKTLEKYFQKMQKIFPVLGEVIISTKNIANAIYLIYEGSCAINSDKYGDLIILEKGDIFGDECLTNYDEDGKIMKKQYLNNIINKSQSTIIFKFLIKDLTKYIINGMKTYLNSYFRKREELVKNHLSHKKEIKNQFMKEYDLFKRPIYEKEIFKTKNYDNNILTKANVQKTFNSVLSELRLNKKIKKYKKSFKPNISKKIKKNPLSIKYLFKNENRKRAFNSPRDIEKKNILNNPKLKTDISTKSVLRKKILWFSESKNHTKTTYPLTNKNSNFNQCLKLLTISDNNNNNNNSNNSHIYITSISNQNNGTMSIKEKCLFTQIRPSSNMERIFIDSSNIHNQIIQKFSSSAFSSNRCSTTYKSKSNNMDALKQIEKYGCPISNAMEHFNNGNNSLLMKRSNSDPYKSGFMNKKKFFYQTQKYNIPLYVFYDKKEKKKFPDLINYFNNL